MKLPDYQPKKLASNITRFREKMDYTREELASATRLSYNTIVKLESGANANPTLDTLIRLSVVFGVRIEDLFK